MRKVRESVIFERPFSLSVLDGEQPAGCYLVEVDEELIEGLSFISYRRVSTTLYLPTASGEDGSMQAVTVDPRELAAALHPAPSLSQPSRHPGSAA
jgi:hypothetical protein